MRLQGCLLRGIWGYVIQSLVTLLGVPSWSISIEDYANSLICQTLIDALWHKSKVRADQLKMRLTVTG